MASYRWEVHEHNRTKSWPVYVEICEMERKPIRISDTQINQFTFDRTRIPNVWMSVTIQRDTSKYFLCKTMTSRYLSLQPVHGSKEETKANSRYDTHEDSYRYVLYVYYDVKISTGSSPFYRNRSESLW